LEKGFYSSFQLHPWMLVILALATLSQAQTQRVKVMTGPPLNVRSIWVLDAGNKLSRYDATQFKMWIGGLPLPADARKHPEAISISAKGEVIVVQGVEGESAVRSWWRSVPTHSQLTGGAWDKHPATGGGYNILSATPDLYFSSDGERLFWFEHREQLVNRGGLDISRDARFLSWITDLDGEDPQKIAEFTFASCKCETGVCEESCPQAIVWAPDEGVSDFFFLTRWVPGQIQSDYQETALYQHKKGAWASRTLGRPVESFLDAADHGEVFIEAIRDGGCCGWENESDDQTLMVSGDKSTAIFDERRRFHNDNYDISFFTEKAKLSPDLNGVAYTLASTARPGQEIRLSDSGKEKPEELKAIQKELPGLPRVEVVWLSAPDRVAVSVEKAELVGWLDAKRLLVVKNGELQLVDAAGKLTPTGVKADAAKYVFLR
jgi:hypothetical protein